ncbi:glycosyltransferase [Butyrivibrio sp. AE2032]|uniref:glycosyltransferase n=1 Tax=Butyrivibrio sp. AE2032 TaxID=1458463 RepID=UPI000557570F|nr:glycosyltransferase [Butyrivibrio sp. AE2032]
MKKILIVNDLITGGGVEKLLQDFVERWHDKCDLTVMSLYNEAEFYDYYPEDVHYLFKTAYRYYKRIIGFSYIKYMALRCFGKLRYTYLQKHNNYDVIIALKDGDVTQFVSKFKAPQKFAWYHTDYNNYYYSEYLYGSKENEFNVLKTYDNVVCVSQDIKDSLIDVLGDTGNYVVKYNPLNVDKILYDGNEPVIETKKTEGRPLFVVVGRINYQKGYNLLLEAVHMLELEGYEFDVNVIGGKENWSDEYERIMRSVKRLGIKSVHFLGLKSNPYKYMKMADWFLSTSIFEGYSLVSQEAAILDVPLLLTDCSGVRELIGDNEYGIIMERSVIGIYNGIKRVLDNPELHAHYKAKIMERKSIIDYENRFEEIEDMVFGD